MSLKICLFVILAQHYLPLYGIMALNYLYFYAFCIVFSIFICMKKPQDINGLKKNHYLCNRISYPKK